MASFVTPYRSASASGVNPSASAARIATTATVVNLAREQGLPVAKVTVWETPDSWATYSA